MKKYVVCLAISLLLLSVSGYAQERGIYDVKMTLSLRDNSGGNCNCTDKNEFQIAYTMSSIKFITFFGEQGFNCGGDWSHGFTMKEGEQLQFVESTGRRGWWYYPSWLGSGGGDYGYKDLSGLSLLTASGYTNTTISDMVLYWNSSLNVTIQPKELKLTYKNGEITSDRAGYLPSKHPITLSCTPGYPNHVYQWQYSNGYEETWSTISSNVPVPCGSGSGADSNEGLTLDGPLQFVENTGKDVVAISPGQELVDYSVYTNEDYLLTYYDDDTHTEYNAQDFFNYFKSKLPNPNDNCSKYVPIPVKKTMPRWVDFPAHINNRASITFTGEELLRGETAFTAQMNTAPVMIVRMNHTASATNTLSLGLQRSAPKLLYAQASTPCAGQRGSLTLYFDRPLDAAVNETLDIAVGKDGGGLDYDGFINIKASQFYGTTYVMNDLEVGSYAIMYKTGIDGADGKRLNTFNSEDTTKATITALPAVTAGISSASIRCPGEFNGSITVTPSGGSGKNYTVALSNGVSAGVASSGYGHTFAGLSAGAYSVQVTDDKGCQMTQPVGAAVHQPAALSAQVTSQTNPSCYGDSNGQITAQASGGSGPYRYTCSGQTSIAYSAVLFSNLSQGNYTVSVTDNNGCTATTPSTTLFQPERLTIYIPGQYIPCYGDTGSLWAEVSGGNSSNTYRWSKRGEPGWSGETSSISGLSPGVYTVTVTDGKNCTATISYDLFMPQQAVTATLTPSGVTCFGDANGSIAVMPSGGMGNNYTAELYSGSKKIRSQSGISNATGHTFADLSAGKYSVIVKDQPGCVSSTVAADVASSTGQRVAIQSLSPQSPSVFGATDGSVSLSASGGAGAYTYALQNASKQTIASNNSGTFTGIGEGAYTVIAKDGNKCEVSEELYLPDPLLIQLHRETPVSCSGSFTGALEVTVQGGLGGYNYQWYEVRTTSQSPIAGATSQILSNRQAGTYGVEVKGIGGFSASATYMLDNPSIVEATLSAGEVKCYGASTGSLFVLPAGGTGNNYTAELYSGNTKIQSASGISNATGHTFTGLSVGDYSVTVRDEAGCASSSYPAKITSAVDQPVAIQNLSSQIPGAYGATDGRISLSASGGAGVYTYTLQNASEQTVASNASGTFTGIGEGAYTVIAKDGNGCAVSFSVYIPNPLLIQLLRQDNILCHGASTGEVEMKEAQGGSGGDYTYQWYEVKNNTTVLIPGETSRILSNRPAGTYRVVAEDRNGLSGSATCVLTENDPVTYGLQVEHVKCYGGTTGAINVNPQGGAGTEYKVRVYSDAGGLLHERQISRGDTWSLSGLHPATYSLKLEDNRGCVADDVTTLIETAKAPLQLSLLGSADPLGYERADGSITLNAAGGVGPYVYTLVADTGQVGHNDRGVFTGMGKGVYDIKLHDARGCADSLQVTLNHPPPLEISWKSYRDIDCKASSSGSLIAYKATGGVGEFTYRWYKQEGEAWNILPSETDTVLNNATAGTYRIEAADANGVTTALTHTLQEPEFVTYTATSMPVHCYGGADGVIEAIAAGGMEQTYRFRLSPVAPENGYPVEVVVSKDTAHRFTGLRAGKYILDLEDHIGCPVHKEEDAGKIIEVGSVAAPLQWADYLHRDPLGYGHDDGWVEITAGGGAAPYAFTFSGPSPAAVSATLKEGESCMIDSLAEGNYHLVITDNNYAIAAVSGRPVDRMGCVDTLTVRLTAPLELKVYIEQLAGISCKGMSTGRIQAIGTGGMLHSGNDYQYEWYKYDDDRQQLEVSANIAEELPAGTYTVKITDNNDIVAWADDFVLIEPEILSITTRTEETACGRNDGVATATVKGGTAPYTYEWSSGHRTKEADSLGAGRYMVFVRDSNRCEIKSFATVAGAGELQLEEQITHPTCYNYKDGSIHLQLKGGQPPYRYLWNDGNTSAAITGLPQGTYSVRLSDAEGCRMEMTYELLHPERLTVDIGDDRTICKGQQAVIKAEASRAIRKYEWYHNGNAYDSRADITASKEGLYSVNVVDEAGCRADTSAVIRFVDVDIAVDFLITGYVALNETVYAVNISWPEPDSIRWVFPENSVVLFEDDNHSAQLRFLSTGTYEVGMLSYKKGCHESIYKTVEVVDEKEDSAAAEIAPAPGVKYAGVYPNPASGYFNVKIELEKDVPVTLRLFTMDGLLLKTEQLQGSTSYEHLFTMPGGVIPGVYFLQILTPDSTKLTKILIY